MLHKFFKFPKPHAQVSTFSSIEFLVQVPNMKKKALVSQHEKKSFQKNIDSHKDFFF